MKPLYILNSTLWEAISQNLPLASVVAFIIFASMIAVFYNDDWKTLFKNFKKR